MVGKVSSDVFDSFLRDLKRLESSFKRLVRKLGENAGFSGENAEKFNLVRERLSAIQRDISSIAGSFSAGRGGSDSVSVQGPPMIIRCKRWDDFKFHALNADTISFVYKEDEKIFQVDAVKSGKVYTYSGELPGVGVLLRAWLSREMGVDESEILEGVLALG